MIDFIVDECTGFGVVKHLRGKGYNVLSVNEDMLSADDSDIIKRAWSENRILITNDKDFGEKVYRDGYQHRGILLLRLSDDRTANKKNVIDAVLQKYEDRLPDSFVVATEQHIRIRSI